MGMLRALQARMHIPLDDYGVLNRLLFNEKVDSEEDLFRILGLVHLFTASGIHIYALMHALERATEWMVRVMGLAGIWLKTLQLWLGLGLLFYLWSLQDFRLGFTRPILVFLLRAWMREKGFRWRVLYPLVLCFIFDWAFGSSEGRVHYYLAVGGGLLALECCESKEGKKKNLILEHAAMALGSWALVAPLDLVSDHLVSWMTPIWSMITLPLISIFLYPITLANWILFHQISTPVIAVWNAGLNFILWAADRGFTFSSVSQASLMWGGGCAAIFTYLLHHWRSKQQKFFLLSGVIFLVFAFHLGEFVWVQRKDHVVQLDVHQGDSLLIRSQGRVEMIDVGSARVWSSTQWIRKLSKYQVTSVDTILLSHLDEDHVGGLHSLLPFVPVAQVQTADAHWQTVKGEKLKKDLEKYTPALSVCSDQCFKSGELRWFRSQDPTHSHGNEWMSGVMIPLSESRVYLALGDGDGSQEEQYFSAFSAEIEHFHERVWKVSHHGSKFSSPGHFLEELHPSQCWISVGRRNPYHHPTVETLERLHQIHTQIHRTDEEGDLVI